MFRIIGIALVLVLTSTAASFTSVGACDCDGNRERTSEGINPKVVAKAVWLKATPVAITSDPSVIGVYDITEVDPKTDQLPDPDKALSSGNAIESGTNVRFLLIPGEDASVYFLNKSTWMVTEHAQRVCSTGKVTLTGDEIFDIYPDHYPSPTSGLGPAGCAVGESPTTAFTHYWGNTHLRVETNTDTSTTGHFSGNSIDTSTGQCNQAAVDWCTPNPHPRLPPHCSPAPYPVPQYTLIPDQ